MDEMTTPSTLIGLSPDAMKVALVSAGIADKAANMRVRQLWNWVYVHGARDFAAMTNLAKDFRADMAPRFSLERPQIVTEQISSDGTRKWLLRGEGGRNSKPSSSPNPAAARCAFLRKSVAR